MTTRTNPNPRSLRGTLATRPDAADVAEGDDYTDQDTGDIYKMVPIAGTPTWVSIGGGTAGSLSAKYWVNASGSLPVVGYTTLEDAIADAVADGHDASDPAAIMMLPGTFSPAGGTLTVPAGISLISVAPGTVTIAADINSSAAAGRSDFIGFVSQSLLVGVGGASTATIGVFDCFFGSVTAGRHAIFLNSTGTTLLVRDSRLDGSGIANGRGIRANGECTVIIDRSVVRGTLAGGSVAGGGDGSFEATNCVFSQQVTGGADDHFTFTSCEFEFSGAFPASVFNGDATTTFEIRGGVTIDGVDTATTAFVAVGVGISNDNSDIGIYTVANLPTLQTFSRARAYAINGRKVGEGPGAGTGVPVYWDYTSEAWLTYSTDAAVLA